MTPMRRWARGLARTPREWLGDIVATVFAAVFGWLMLLAALQDSDFGSPAQIRADVAFSVAGLVVHLLWRRRYPGRVAAVMILLGVPSSTAQGASAMGAYAVAAHGTWRATATVTGVMLGYLVLMFSVIPMESLAVRVEAIVTIGSLLLVVVAVGLIVRSRRQLVQSLQERARQAEEGQRLRVEEGRLLERERIAREMHDVLAHRISLLAMHAGALEFRSDAPSDQRTAAGVIRQNAYEAMEDLRQVIGMLRDDDDAADRPQPDLTDLTDLVAQSRAAGANVALESDPAALGDVPARVGRHAYRIVQEGLTNARKHAPGAHVRVDVRVRGGVLRVEVANLVPPGPAPEPPLPGAGVGLVGLAERVALVEGLIEHGRTGDGRFVLRANLPLN